MGFISHNAIIVSGSYDVKPLAGFDADWQKEFEGRPWIEVAHEKAMNTFTVCAVTPIVPGDTNGYRFFMVAPDGSKEGWGTSDKGDAERAAYRDWLNSTAYSDASTPLSWVEVQFGNDDCETKTVDSSDDFYVRAHPEWFDKEVANG